MDEKITGGNSRPMHRLVMAVLTSERPLIVVVTDLLCTSYCDPHSRYPTWSHVMFEGVYNLLFSLVSLIANPPTNHIEGKGFRKSPATSFDLH